MPCSQEEKTVSIVIIALVAPLALLGVIVVTVAAVTMQLQQAEEAGCPINTPGVNASKARCYRGG